MAQWLRMLWRRISRYLVVINAEAIQGMPVSPGARQRAGQVEVAEHQPYQARQCCRVVVRQRPGNLLALQPEILPPATGTSSTDAWQGYNNNTYLQGQNMLKAFKCCQTEVTAVPIPADLTGAFYEPRGLPGLPQMVTGLSVPGACARCCLTQSSGLFSLPSELRQVLQGWAPTWGQASDRNQIL